MRAARRLLERGGIGMSGIAEVLANMGYVVTGSDIQPSEITKHLESVGCKMHYGHAADHVADVDVVVVSSAIKGYNPEVEAARARAIPVIPRAEMLGELTTELAANGHVEGGERLVQEQQVGVTRQCPRQRDPLCLSPGELAGSLPFGAAEPEEADPFARPRHGLPTVDSPAPRAERDVLQDIQMGEQHVILEHHPDALAPVDRRLPFAQRPHILPRHLDQTRIRPIHRRDHGARRVGRVGEAEVPAQEAGVVTAVAVREGQRVKEGDLLTQVDDQVESRDEATPEDASADSVAEDAVSGPGTDARSESQER